MESNNALRRSVNPPKRKKVPLKNLIRHWTSEAMDITRKVFPYVVLGVGLGAIIHGFIPESNHRILIHPELVCDTRLPHFLVFPYMPIQ
ncbi:hypothetical protein COV53_06105 [Candidatus Gottesmanbacteria bacterium CG11_big_fil_rev_8_21_14_0_20_37_11]|uniref:Uncharacterized protein n=3 Tax=Candidatus Gottesmaniibacteriota TaxID=1752720 RepID=A0A2M7RPZ3_9BACT|nr:MAG: hypothetical protein AUJ73_03390 [Candidatus Gottesmanbacteria bacterium CG1_02_37_22]PIR07873.1 MAG: hypothetical protein COV53_06105 [Candidatus Gottesmanbacteria bacterium CG11_big_fil_rev_8_21_14_0_20_37_11]PIZ02388.1 MAG: hypothetical protein COY59_05235 [Candidatus Gottesmanbacteria bacterium CG_4_10_14_0_8_um_filter_37_24]